jgi:hypothetical protein
MGDHASMRRLLAFLVKAAVSALLLYLSLRRVDLDSVGQRLGGLDWRWIAFILFMLCVAMLLRCDGGRSSRSAVPSCRWRWRCVTASSASFSVKSCRRRSGATPSASGCWRAARGGAGLAESDGLIVSILYGAASLAVGAIGGIVWVASGYRWRSVKTIEADTLAHDPSA